MRNIANNNAQSQQTGLFPYHINSNASALFAEEAAVFASKARPLAAVKSAL